MRKDQKAGKNTQQDTSVIVDLSLGKIVLKDTLDLINTVWNYARNLIWG